MSEELERLRREATHDSLTGLPNRRGLEIELDRLINEMPGGFSLVSVDLDKLKRVNDTEGFDKGDELLKNAAGVLSESVRTHYSENELHDERTIQTEHADIVTAARLGGDEFIILLPGVNDNETLGRVIKRIQKDLVRNDISASLDGVAHIEGEAAEDILKSADQRMKQDKQLRNEARFNELPWYKKRAARVGDRLLRFAGVNPPRQ